MNSKIYASLALLSIGMMAAQPAEPVAAIKTQALQDLQARYADYRQVAQSIWGFAEVGYKETKSSALLQKTLKDNGFTVQAGVADIPTAFVATYGSGKPVIGILAEFDAERRFWLRVQADAGKAARGLDLSNKALD